MTVGGDSRRWPTRRRTATGLCLQPSMVLTVLPWPSTAGQRQPRQKIPKATHLVLLLTPIVMVWSSIWDQTKRTWIIHRRMLRDSNDDWLWPSVRRRCLSLRQRIHTRIMWNQQLSPPRWPQRHQAEWRSCDWRQRRGFFFGNVWWGDRRGGGHLLAELVEAATSPVLKYMTPMRSQRKRVLRDPDAVPNHQIFA